MEPHLRFKPVVALESVPKAWSSCGWTAFQLTDYNWEKVHRYGRDVERGTLMF
jgi:hypothetical protein